MSVNLASHYHRCPVTPLRSIDILSLRKGQKRQLRKDNNRFLRLQAELLENCEPNTWEFIIEWFRIRFEDYRRRAARGNDRTLSGKAMSVFHEKNDKAKRILDEVVDRACKNGTYKYMVSRKRRKKIEEREAKST